MEQFIMVKVNKQTFAIPVLSTSQILSVTDITPVPDTSDYILGVISTEGKVLPIIDLSTRFFAKDIELNETSQALVVFWNNQEIALLVDDILGIQVFNEEQIDTDLQKITSLEHAAEVTPINAFIKAEHDIILSLDIDDMFDRKGSLQIQELIEAYLDRNE